MPKVASQWKINSNIGTVDTYDSTSIYDGSGSSSAFDSYDGVPLGQNPNTIKNPQIWSTTAKTAQKWVSDPNAVLLYDISTSYDSMFLYNGNPTSVTTKIPTNWSNV